MKLFLALPALALLVAPTIPHADAADRIGVRTIAVPAPARGTQLDVTLWYPTISDDAPVVVGDNAVFKGSSAHRDAPIASGSFPIILLSHGGLRAAPNLGVWIASRLAAQGFIVAAPHPPKPNGQNAWDATREIWLRPADLSATLTAVERDPGLAGRIDAREVGILGFLLGGSSALALAGARVDAETYARSCDNGGVGLDCAWFTKSGVDLHEVDTTNVGRSNLDPRIKAVVAVDPELTTTFSAASLSGISIPVHIINLGRPDTILPGLRAASLEKQIPGARYDLVPDATQFDSFNECKPEGPAILRREGDDESLCNYGTRPREEIHAQLAAMIAAIFKHRLPSGLRSREERKAPELSGRQIPVQAQAATQTTLASPPPGE
jgi:predicted dienelactone hydrolase